ncbi:MAG: ribosome maturation factor RimM [Burkholderiales bacterium]
MADSGADTTTWPADAIEVGIIIDAWGVKGWFKVKAFSANPQALFSSKRWLLRPAEAIGPRSVLNTASLPSLLKIVAAKDHGDLVVAQAQDVVDRPGAEALRGARVFVPRGSFPTAGPDEYYWVDLVGLAVVNRQGEQLGDVVGLIDTGPHSVLRVAPAGVTDEAEQRLIPFVAAFVDAVSLPERRITVDWGLNY